jgi:hypothetical protein
VALRPAGGAVEVLENAELLRLAAKETDQKMKKLKN